LVNPLESLRSIEPQYFVDYCSFSGQAREYVSDSLSAAFWGDPNPIRRRHHLIGLLAQEYAAYEDAAAILKAFLDFGAGVVAFPLVTLMDYRPGEAELDRVLGGYKIYDTNSLVSRLRVLEWMPRAWQDSFPDIDLEKCIRFSCQFLVQDCRFNQKRYGVAAYNKIKHGLMVVPSAREYIYAMPDTPAAIFSTKKFSEVRDESPFILYGFPMDDAKIREHERLIHFVQKVLRLLAGLYLSATYPKRVQQVWGGGPDSMFSSGQFRDIRDFMREVTTNR
jgi:hypothetical protein